MKRRLDAIKANPTVAHLLRAQVRFGNRMGNQFAAAITYFSVLALVPILMFAFSVLGMTLTVLRPDWMDQVSNLLVENLSGDTGHQLSDLILEYLRNWRGVGIIGLLSLSYAGSGWVGNLRAALHAQWRPEFEHVKEKRNIVVKALANLGTLLLLLLGVLVTFAFSMGGTALNGWLVGLLNIDAWPGGQFLLRVVTYLLTAISAWLLFMVIFILLPNEHGVTRVKMIGSIIGAIAFTALQIGAGALIGVFTGNRAAALFGPVIVLMLFMNLFARIVLFIGSWIATEKQPAIAFHYNEADEPLRGRADTVSALDHWEQAGQERADIRSEKDIQLTKAELPSVLTTARPRVNPVYKPKLVTLDDYPQASPDRHVSEEVAAKSVKVGMRAGWVTGVATGVGVGALATAAIGGLKKLVTEAVNEGLAGHRARRAELLADLPHLRGLLAEGNARANAVADATLAEVRTAMQMVY